ncbi:phospholipase a-2-activating protein [Anaeramoeba flamelloides]|uniref:Phospholipase a-2-activating protein n=1 Tax=Anaeramoeba flamelloides TaxID=1746091 RepID=A0AAV7YPB1_9EUKA|nr:phospholipase a-2-activating protein [Anaeramoeba flamelloides]
MEQEYTLSHDLSYFNENVFTDWFCYESGTLVRINKKTVVIVKEFWRQQDGQHIGFELGELFEPNSKLVCAHGINKGQAVNYEGEILIAGLSTGPLILCDLTEILHTKDIMGNIVKFFGHTGPITCITTNSKGELITGSRDTNIYIWNTQKKWLKSRKLYQLQSHKSPIMSVVSLRDETIVSGSSDGEIRFWKNYQCTKRIKVKNKTVVRHLQPYMDYAFLVCNGTDTCTCYKYDGSEVLFEIKSPNNTPIIHAATFSNSTDEIFLVQQDKKFLVYRYGKYIQAISSFDPIIKIIAFSRNTSFSDNSLYENNLSKPDHGSYIFVLVNNSSPLIFFRPDVSLNSNYSIKNYQEMLNFKRGDKKNDICVIYKKNEQNPHLFRWSTTSNNWEFVSILNTVDNKNKNQNKNKNDINKKNEKDLIQRNENEKNIEIENEKLKSELLKESTIDENEIEKEKENKIEVQKEIQNIILSWKNILDYQLAVSTLDNSNDIKKIIAQIETFYLDLSRKKNKNGLGKAKQILYKMVMKDITLHFQVQFSKKEFILGINYFENTKNHCYEFLLKNELPHELLENLVENIDKKKKSIPKRNELKAKYLPDHILFRHTKSKIETMLKQILENNETIKPQAIPIKDVTILSEFPKWFKINTTDESCELKRKKKILTIILNTTSCWEQDQLFPVVDLVKYLLIDNDFSLLLSKEENAIQKILKKTGGLARYNSYSTVITNWRLMQNLFCSKYTLPIARKYRMEIISSAKIYYQTKKKNLKLAVIKTLINSVIEPTQYHYPQNLEDLKNLPKEYNIRKKTLELLLTILNIETDDNISFYILKAFGTAIMADKFSECCFTSSGSHDIIFSMVIKGIKFKQICREIYTFFLR